MASSYKERLLRELEEFPAGEIPRLYRLVHFLRKEWAQKDQKQNIWGSLKGIWKGVTIEDQVLSEAKRSLFSYESR